MKSPLSVRGRYAILLALFALAASYHVRSAAGVVDALLSQDDRVRSFDLRMSASILLPVVQTVRPDEANAGLRPNDRILAIEDRPLDSLGVLEQALARARPGQAMAVRVRHASGLEETLTLILAPRPWRQDVVPTLIEAVAMPLFCLLLGFWVAAVRVRDGRAWLFLGLMLSMIPGSRAVLAWGDGWRPLGIAYGHICVAMQPMMLFLFGLYFPDRLRWERRHPWLKWLLLVPLAVVGLLRTLLHLGESENLALAYAVLPLWLPVLNPWIWLLAAAKALFFAALGVKWGRTEQADARRRLRLLTLGAVVSLVPEWGLTLVGWMRWGNDMLWLWPAWAAAPAFLLKFLFPLTLAYVILVERALDVRVVIRQGVQYALARGSIRVLQLAAILAAIALAASLAAAPDTAGALKIGAIVLAVAVVALAERSAAQLAAWVDRRFFRDAYDAEKILVDLTDEIRTMVETAPLLRTVAENLSRALHVPRVAMLLDEGGGFQPSFTLGYDAGLDIRFPATADLVERVKKDGALRIYMDDADSWVHRLPPESASERAALERLATQLVLPLAVKEKLLGLMSLGPKRSEEPFSNADLRLLRSVAAHTGLALENSRLTSAIAQEVALRERHRRELEIAREVQEQLFPQRHPEVPRLDYHGVCRPARDVGGDSYDFIELGEGRFGFAIGDVSGKGIPAALLMAGLQASLRAQTLHGIDDLARLISNVNRLVYDASPSNRYATFFYAQLDPATLMLSYVNAGHNAPMLFRDDAVLRFDTGGPVIGLLPEAVYQQADVALRSGDVLVAFTDGISEAMNSTDEEWGEERLTEAVRRTSATTAADLARELHAAADAFAAGAPQHDDMTLLVLRIL